MKTKSRTSLVLMELIICVLFFSVASAVCVQLFVNAHLISKHTFELNCAVAKAQGFAEVMRGTDGSYDSIIEMFPEAYIENENGFSVYYDSDFNTIDYNDKFAAEYSASVTLEKVSKIQNMYINIVRLSDDETIYSLNATKYIRNK